MKFPALLVACASAVTAVAAEEKITFNEHIRPILADNCFGCHGTDASHRKAKLRLDTLEGATAEKNGFRAITPGDISKSEAWQRRQREGPEISWVRERRKAA